MSDEIKEILDDLKIKSDRYNHHLKYNLAYENKEEDYKAKILLDHIINLQEDYEKEKYLVDKYTRQLTDEYKNTEYQCKQKEDYKSRNEEAREKLESIRIFGLRSGKILFSTLINETIDILDGGYKDE